MSKHTTKVLQIPPFLSFKAPICAWKLESICCIRGRLDFTISPGWSLTEYPLHTPSLVIPQKKLPTHNLLQISNQLYSSLFKNDVDFF